MLTIRSILGLYGDNGKGNGSYYVVYRGYIGIMLFNRVSGFGDYTWWNFHFRLRVLHEPKTLNPGTQKLCNPKTLNPNTLEP